MRKNGYLILTFVIITLAWAVEEVWAGVKTNMSMESQILGRQVKFSVYIPDSYYVENKKFPVLYLLHGLGDDHLAWATRGNINEIADRTINDNRACEMIIIMPDAGDSWYVNSFDGKVRYEDMFFEELIPHVDKTFKTIPHKSKRAVAGLSMGGSGALMYAMKKPEMFVACGAMSAAIYQDSDFYSEAPGTFPVIFKRIFGPQKPNTHWANNSALHLVSKYTAQYTGAVKYFIDCGDDDFLYRGNALLHIVMRDKKIKHEFRVRDGGHSWQYWKSGVVLVMEFVSEAFRE